MVCRTGLPPAPATCTPTPLFGQNRAHAPCCACMPMRAVCGSLYWHPRMGVQLGPEALRALPALDHGRPGNCAAPLLPGPFLLRNSFAALRQNSCTEARRLPRPQSDGQPATSTAIPPIAKPLMSPNYASPLPLTLRAGRGLCSQIQRGAHLCHRQGRWAHGAPEQPRPCTTPVQEVPRGPTVECKVSLFLPFTLLLCFFGWSGRLSRWQGAVDAGVGWRVSAESAEQGCQQAGWREHVHSFLSAASLLESRLSHFFTAGP